MFNSPVGRVVDFIVIYVSGMGTINPNSIMALIDFCKSSCIINLQGIS